MGQCMLKDCGLNVNKTQGKEKEDLDVYIKETIKNTYIQNLADKFTLKKTTIQKKPTLNVNNNSIVHKFSFSNRSPNKNSTSNLYNNSKTPLFIEKEMEENEKESQPKIFENKFFQSSSPTNQSEKNEYDDIFNTEGELEDEDFIEKRFPTKKSLLRNSKLPDKKDNYIHDEL